MEGINFDLSDSSLWGLNEKFLNNCTNELRDEILELMVADSNELFGEVIGFYTGTGELKEGLNTELIAEMLTTLTIFLTKRLMDKPNVSKEEAVSAVDDMLGVIETGIIKG